MPEGRESARNSDWELCNCERAYDFPAIRGAGEKLTSPYIWRRCAKMIEHAQHGAALLAGIDGKSGGRIFWIFTIAQRGGATRERG